MKPNYRYNWKKGEWELVIKIPMFTHPEFMMPHQKTFEYVTLVEAEIENKVTLAAAGKEFAKAIQAVFERNGVK